MQPDRNAAAGVNGAAGGSRDKDVDSNKRHDMYYIDDGDLHFLVEKTTFRVHSYFFTRESKHWKGQLAGPVSPGDKKPRPGSDDSAAINLSGRKAADFASFLWVFYNPHFDVYETTVDRWIAILRLACEWGFEEVQRLAIDSLRPEKMDLIERIKLYRDLKVSGKHLYPLYVELARRPEIITPEEFRKLDPETMALVAHVRESLRARPSKKGPISPVRDGVGEAEMLDTISRIFGLTTEEIRG